jgi:pyrroline-5-carboxylate reductase
MNSLKDSTIGCIGTGNMGAAIVAGISNKIAPDRILCFDTDREKLEHIHEQYKISMSDTPEELLERCQIVILAVKPDVITTVLTTIKKLVSDKLIVSIAAGISINSIEDIIGSDKNIIRVMPNTPALIGEGMTVISPNKKVEAKYIELVKEIFSLLGTVMVLPEKHMDAVTALSGCGPAYGFTLIQAMTDGGVKMGIPRDKALLLSAQTIAGAAKLVLESNEEPIVLRGRVTSPGGSTIDAIHILERAGFSGIVMDAVELATKKSAKLGGDSK